jgi:hypothetical protein
MTPRRPKAYEFHPGEAERLTPILLRLKDAGVTDIEFMYDGSGDEGYVNDVYFYTGDALLDDPTEDTAHEALIQWASDMIDRCFPSWEIADGATGTLTVNLRENKLVFNHGERITTEEWSEVTRSLPELGGAWSPEEVVEGDTPEAG